MRIPNEEYTAQLRGSGYTEPLILEKIASCPTVYPGSHNERVEKCTAFLRFNGNEPQTYKILALGCFAPR
jgi:hypothetical protein